MAEFVHDSLWRIITSRFPLVARAGTKAEAAADIALENQALQVSRELDACARRCLGRTAELASLEAFCTHDWPRPVSRIVHGTRGSGKTELLGALEASLRTGARVIPVAYLHGRPVRAGSAMGVVAQLCHRAIDVLASIGHPVPARVAKRAAPVPTSAPRLSALLSDILAEFPRPPVLILDGLDDCGGGIAKPLGFV
jgi:hypothetical protein